MLKKLFESNLRVKISNGCLIGPVLNVIKTTHVNVFIPLTDHVPLNSHTRLSTLILSVQLNFN